MRTSYWTEHDKSKSDHIHGERHSATGRHGDIWRHRMSHEQPDNLHLPDTVWRKQQSILGHSVRSIVVICYQEFGLGGVGLQEKIIPVQILLIYNVRMTIDSITINKNVLPIF